MIAVVFEVEPLTDQKQRYLDIAAGLKPLLEQVDGFISVERFQSLVDERKILSLSFFRDETVIQEWCTLEQHRAAQCAGRASVFANYRLSVAGISRDCGMVDSEEAPMDSQSIHGP